MIGFQETGSKRCPHFNPGHFIFAVLLSRTFEFYVFGNAFSAKKSVHNNFC